MTLFRAYAHDNYGSPGESRPGSAARVDACSAEMDEAREDYTEGDLT